MDLSYSNFCYIYALFKLYIILVRGVRVKITKIAFSVSGAVWLSPFFILLNFTHFALFLFLNHHYLLITSIYINILLILSMRFNIPLYLSSNINIFLKKTKFSLIHNNTFLFISD